MSSDCKNKNPIQRSGVNQYQRVLDALKPSFVNADEHDYADLILFAKNYAAHLKYYNSLNQEDGDWIGLMSMDVSVTLASIIKTDIEGCFGYTKSVLEKIQKSSALPDAKNYFKVMFDFGFSIIKLLNEYYKNLPEEFEFKQILGSLISSNLPEYYYRLTEYYNEAVTQGLIDNTSEFVTGNEPVTFIFSQDFDSNSLDKIWNLSAFSFTPSFNGSTDLLKIKNTATHNLFTGIFDELLKTFSGIINTSQKYLDIVIENYPEHSPHYSLYLTFIKLFRYAQNHLNEFTKRHLDLYYKEILQLKNREAVPDEVHVTFELQKNTEQHLLKSGTVLKAGKDIDGNEIFYSLDEDIVINKGTIKSLKNIYAKKDINAGTKQIFACPVANSEDGTGGKLESADQSWKTFGSPETSPLGEIGFAVASPYLYLTEGNRDITFRFYISGSVPIGFTVNEINELFNLQFSGEKGWIDVPVDAGSVRVDASKEFFEITVALDGGDDAVVPYSGELHLYNFNVSMPVAKFILKNSTASDAVLDFSFEKIMIITSVENLKNVKIQNDQSILDPSKAFEFFGVSPHAGSSFIIGSNELFIKTLNPAENITGKIKLTWDDFDNIPDSLKSNEISVEVLENSEWSSTGSKENLFSSSNIADIKTKNSYQFFSKISMDNEIAGSITEFSNIDFTLKKMNVGAVYSETENYSVKSKWGFLKLDSKDSFPVVNDVIYSPKIKELSISYDAAVSHTFRSDETSAFIHITPFGSKAVSNNDSSKPLFPAFENEGELYIGVENFKTDQTLSILFKVSEGSADPLISKEEINWSYLGSNNEWLDFEKEDITDSTDDLTNTGIIIFNISDKASSENTLMTEQLHWIRATVSENTNAVCKLINVIAQAATASYSDYKNTGNYFKNILAANTISKLLISDSSVKKITQPYSSINGKTKETDEHFYTRVSERLRHKNRAIAMWDYERIVLEEFPQIYKAKCINHSQILEETAAGKTVYIDNELKPGYVLLIPIPDIRNQNAYDPLRPYTSLGLLTDIKKYLYKYISPHVNLDVRNPLFEEIQLEFKVKFMSEDNEFYEKELKLEIEQFMSPWAYDPETDIEFAGKINKSSLIDFIEERSYVDFISCVKMFHIVDGKKSQDLEEAGASTSRSVFVSVKSDDTVNAHKISFIKAECECDGK